MRDIHYLHMNSKIQLRKMTSYSYHKIWELRLPVDSKKTLIMTLAEPPSPSRKDPLFLSDKLNYSGPSLWVLWPKPCSCCFPTHTGHLTELKEPIATASKRQLRASSTSWTPLPQNQSQLPCASKGFSSVNTFTSFNLFVFSYPTSHSSLPTIDPEWFSWFLNSGWSCARSLCLE